MVARSRIFIIVLLLYFINSCNNKQEVNIAHEGLSTGVIDTILYILPAKLENFIGDSLINDKSVHYCEMVTNLSNNVFTLSFPYGDYQSIKSEKIKILINKTNRYLKIQNKYLPVLFESDMLFSTIPKDKKYYISDFNFSYVTFNHQGDVLKSVKF